MGTKSIKELESVGWKTWLVLSILLMYPGYLFAKAVMYDYQRGLLIMVGIVSALLTAGLLASVLNEILFRFARRRYNERKKQGRKEKKK